MGLPLLRTVQEDERGVFIEIDGDYYRPQRKTQTVRGNQVEYMHTMSIDYVRVFDLNVPHSDETWVVDV